MSVYDPDAANLSAWGALVEKQSKGLKALEVTTGGTRGGLTISTGLEIELSKEVKEVKGCCTLL